MAATGGEEQRGARARQARSAAFWERAAALPGLSPVVDYAAAETPWARYLTALHRAALAPHLPRVTGGEAPRLLDFGCGVGRLAGWLRGRGYRVVGVDPSPAMVDEARRRLGGAPGLGFWQLPADPRQAGLSGFDGAVAVWVLQHILDEGGFERALEALFAALRPGGRLLALDRLCREAVDHGESHYMVYRGHRAQRQALQGAGFVLEQDRPVMVDEQVLGRAGLTARVKAGMPGAALLCRLDLRWAGGQGDAPFLADRLLVCRRPAERTTATQRVS